jgi:hypothetical protein
MLPIKNPVCAPFDPRKHCVSPFVEWPASLNAPKRKQRDAQDFVWRFNHIARLIYFRGGVAIPHDTGSLALKNISSPIQLPKGADLVNPLKAAASSDVAPQAEATRCKVSVDDAGSCWVQNALIAVSAGLLTASLPYPRILTGELAPLFGRREKFRTGRNTRGHATGT